MVPMIASKNQRKSYAWWCCVNGIAAAAALVFAADIAFAQQADGLRGQVSDDEINESLLGRRPLATRPTALQRQASEEDTGFQAPDYEPVSDGADVPDEDNRQEGDAVSIFDLNRDNPFMREAERPARRARRDAAGDDTDESVVTTRQRIEAEQASRSVGTDSSDEDDDEIIGTVPQAQIDALDEERNTAAETTGERVGAIEGLDREAEEDPYAALGIRTGTFILYPEVEQGLSWSSNADSSSGGGEAVLSETTLRLNAQSDWSRHSAQIEAFGTYRKSLSGVDISEFSGGITAGLRLDLANGFAANAGFEYNVTPETATSAVVIPGTVSQPLLHALTGTLGIAREEGKLRFAATGQVERLIYGDAELGGGGVLSQRERNSTLATATLRTGYEVSPAFVPFVEVEIGRRIMDLRVDTAGFARSANRYAVRAGVELDLGDKLTGEIAAGLVTETPDDSRLEAVEGISALAALVWSPSRGTTVNLDASTTIETATQAGVSGSILYDANFSVERQLRANLTGNVTAGLGYREFSGSSEHDLIMDFEMGLTWWLNRNFGITGRGGYEVVDSNAAGRDAETASVFLGVRYRR